MPPPSDVPDISVHDYTSDPDPDDNQPSSARSSNPLTNLVPNRLIPNAIRPNAVRISRSRAGSTATTRPSSADGGPLFGPGSAAGGGGVGPASEGRRTPDDRDLEANIQSRPQSSLYHDPEQNGSSTWGSLGRMVGRKRASTVGAADSDATATTTARTNEFRIGGRTGPGLHPASAAGGTGPASDAGDATSVTGGETSGDEGGGATMKEKVKGRRRAFSAAASRWWFGPAEGEAQLPEDPETRLARERAEYDRQVVDLLDVIDPEVSTLSTVTDLQNSLFVPDLGRFVDRAAYLRITRPTNALIEDLAAGHQSRDQASSSTSTSAGSPTSPSDSAAGAGSPARRSRKGSKGPKHLETIPQGKELDEKDKEKEQDGTGEKATKKRPAAERAVQARGEYYILPEGLVDWNTWTQDEKADLDNYVRHLLRSKRWRFRRGLRGFRHYVRTPLGAFVTIYASLLAFWGAAWFLFLIGWLSAGSRQAYFIEICDQILTALFCVVGIGLAPFRAVDTYHMFFIAKYHRKTLKLYQEQGAPPLPDENDLPDPTARDREDTVRKPVLTVEEQAKLIYHQTKFAKSHTFYRPHETRTHRAFPLDLLITVVLLLDCHSLFQMALGSTTWSISYHNDYKKVLTSVILACSISINISAGIVIVIGNRRTRKRAIIEEMLRKSLTEEAIRRRQRQKSERGAEGNDLRQGSHHHGITGTIAGRFHGSHKRSNTHGHGNGNGHGSAEHSRSMSERIADFAVGEGSRGGRTSSDVGRRLINPDGANASDPTVASPSAETFDPNVHGGNETPGRKPSRIKSLLRKRERSEDEDGVELRESPASSSSRSQIETGTDASAGAGGAAADAVAGGGGVVANEIREPEKARTTGRLGGLLGRKNA